MALSKRVWELEAMEAKYKELGELILSLRLKAGISQQSDLAALIKKSQQTVSRWELGVTRPAFKEMPLLAKVLNVDVDTLLNSAGYGVKVVVTPFDQPFPIDSLSPDSFERFCLYFLTALYASTGAAVHRVGTQGHTQDGLDIEVNFPDKSRLTFQCKRVDEFGPSKVKTAVAAHKRQAKKKHLVLSRIASPKARQALDGHIDWEIWDKEDMSKKIRQELSREQQVRLVDIFFPGQRLALLGETEYGPWQTVEEFFAPYEDTTGIFSHGWQLVGRAEEVQSVIDSLCNEIARVVFLTGAGGAGKSRVLKEAVENYAVKHPDVLVRFLAPNQEISARSLQELGEQAKLIVVDDAHDRLDLAPLFQYVAVPASNATLLLASRPYGLELLKSQAANFSLSGDKTSTTKVAPLTLVQAEQLSTQVLKKFGGPLKAAKDIARITLDCTLATVIASHVVAKEPKHLELIKNEDAFRSTLMGRFQQIIAGDLGNKSDADAVKRLFKVIALVQPFSPEDTSIAALVETLEGLNTPETNRLIRALSAGGVLFKRGGKYRLSPDMLADFIMESACVGDSGTSTGYAEKVFEAASIRQIKNLLVNLGKLDWRRSNGDPSNSPLLNEIWKRVQGSDSYIAAVTEVAYYQPGRALEFAEQLIRERRALKDLPRLIKHAGYDIDYLQRACECLWEIGKDDPRQLNQHPDHAIRILKELCAVETDKPLTYNEVVIDFAIGLMRRADSWTHVYTPLDILRGILATDGHSVHSSGPHMTVEPFLVNPHAVAVLRKRVIEAAMAVLSGEDIKKALLAADFLGDAVHYPVRGCSEDFRTEWTKQFVDVLQKLETVLLTTDIDALIFVKILQEISWHAKYADGETANIAHRIIALQPSTVEFRTTRAFLDGYGELFERDDHETWQRDVNAWMTQLIADLLSKYPVAPELWKFLEQQLEKISVNCSDKMHSAHALIARVIASSPSLAEEILEDANADKPLAVQFAGLALSKVFRDNHEKGIAHCQTFLKSSCIDLHAAIGRAYLWSEVLRKECSADDLKILGATLESKAPSVADSALMALQVAGPRDRRQITELAKRVDLTISKRLMDDVFGLFSSDEAIRELTDSDTEYFLNRLMEVPELDGHWIETFLAQLSKHRPNQTAKFFMKRVERAVETEDWHYRPCNHYPYGHVPLRFRESDEFPALLREIAHWMRSNEDDFFRHRAGELFDVMFSPFDTEMLRFLEEWIARSVESDIRVIAHILSLNARELIFNHTDIILMFLDRAKQYGNDVLTEATKVLYGAATSGMRSGTVGEPFPEDVKLKEHVDKSLEGLSRFAPAYTLFDWLRKYADSEIKQSFKQRELFED